MLQPPSLEATQLEEEMQDVEPLALEDNQHDFQSPLLSDDSDDEENSKEAIPVQTTSTPKSSSKRM